ncbi:MAG: TRAP-type mannitol/chloroaromatic compound transport system permease small subunit [Oceanicoccus sp.]|jgi:TRAP-type mannitol/chloroaromatic compound transport system permease small subunit
MHIIRTIQYSIDTLTDISGRLLLWLTLLMMAVVCIVVTLRYVFQIGSIGLQEFAIYLHGSVFMLGAAYTLKENAHVRVDIFYRNFSKRGQAWINSLGGIIFLLPLCVYIFVISWAFVAQSWEILEVSPEPGGIPAVFLLKTLIPGLAISLGLQAVAEILRNALILIEEDE